MRLELKRSSASKRNVDREVEEEEQREKENERRK